MTTLRPGWENMGGRVLWNSAAGESITYPLRGPLAANSGWTQDVYNKVDWTNTGPVYPSGTGAQVAISDYNTLLEAYDGGLGPTPIPVTLTPGEDAGEVGFISGAFGVVSPTQISGLDIFRFSHSKIDGMGAGGIVFGSIPPPFLQLPPGVTTLTGVVNTDSYGPTGPYVWNPISTEYEWTDVLFRDYLLTKIGIPVDIDFFAA